MEAERQKFPIRLNLTIENSSLKKIVEQGRLMEFVDAVSAQASAHIKAQVLDQVAKGALVQGSAVSVLVGFEDDNRYGTRPPRPFPWPHAGIWESAMREVVLEGLVKDLQAGM